MKITTDNGLTFVLLAIGAVILTHIFMWAVSKGVIWVMFSLFNINWYSKFWVVYVLVLLLGCIFNGGRK